MTAHERFMPNEARARPALSTETTTADVLRLANATAATLYRDPGDFVMTETAKDILRSFDLIRSMDGPAMTMIAGAPGTGKSRAIAQRLDQDDMLVGMSCAAGEGKPTGLGVALLRQWRVNANGKSLPVQRELLGRHIGRGRALIIDEAQYLEPAGAEWLRAMSEEAGFDLILCGDLALYTLVAGIPQLQSRMRRPVMIERVSSADVAAVAAGTGFDDRAALSALTAVSAQRGGLRNVENVIRLARLFAGRDIPTLGHLRSAITDMKLDRGQA